MIRTAISHARLMRESTDRVQIALRSDNTHEQLIAHRILETPSAWQQWENEHAGLMRHVANQNVMPRQAAVLKLSALRLIHRKALFEFLRDDEIRGAARADILAHFHPARSYEHAVVAEHNVYLRKACSYLCAGHVGSDVVHDPDFLDPMQRYAELYKEYFAVYCGSFSGAAVSEGPLLPLLKLRINQCRRAILNPRRGVADFRRDAELLRPMGDTQRMGMTALRPKNQPRVR